MARQPEVHRDQTKHSGRILPVPCQLAPQNLPLRAGPQFLQSPSRGWEPTRYTPVSSVYDSTAITLLTGSNQLECMTNPLCLPCRVKRNETFVASKDKSTGNASGKINWLHFSFTCGYILNNVYCVFWYFAEVALCHTVLSQICYIFFA